MKAIALLLILMTMLCVGVGACGDHTGVEAQLDRADALMDTYPDTALKILHEIDSSLLSEADAARYALLLSQAYDKTGFDIADDSLISVALDYYMSHPGYRQVLARTCYYRGVVAYNAKDYQCSIHYLSLADTLAAAFSDYHLRGMANAMLACNNGKLLNYMSDLLSAQKALRFFTLDGDSVRSGTQMQYLAMCYLQLDNPEMALSILDNPSCMQDDYVRTSCLLQLGRIEEAEAIMAVHPELARDSKLLVRYARQLLQRGDIMAAEPLLQRAYRYVEYSSDSASCLGLKAELLKRHGHWQEYSAMLEDGLAEYDEAWNASIHDTHPLGYAETLNSVAGLERVSINARNHLRNVVSVTVIIILVLCSIGGFVIMYLRHHLKITQYDKMLMLARRECEEIESDVKKLRVENQALSEKCRITDDIACRYNPDDIEDMVATIKVEINDILGRYIATPSTKHTVIADLKAELNKTLTCEHMKVLEYYVDIKNKGIITQLRASGIKESYVRIYIFEQLGFGNNTIAILVGSKSEKTIANNKTYVRKQIAQLLGQR